VEYNNKNNSNINPKGHNITSVKVNGYLSCNGQIIMDAYILANEQFGFSQAPSTNNVYFYLINNILSALNCKLLVGGIFCDLHKVYDSVNYNIFLSKLELYWITGTVYNLIRSYLQDRYQRVLVNSHSNKYFSKWECFSFESHRDLYLVPCFFSYM
jgi:hypothetical protein